MPFPELPPTPFDKDPIYGSWDCVSDLTINCNIFSISSWFGVIPDLQKVPIHHWYSLGSLPVMLRCQPVGSLLLSSWLGRILPSRILLNSRPIALTCVRKLYTTIMDMGGCHLYLRMGTLTRQLRRHLCLSPQGAPSTKQAGFHHPKRKDETNHWQYAG